MKWWWILGLLVAIALLYANDTWYGNAATFWMPISWMVSILVLVRMTHLKHKWWSGFVALFLISATIILSIPTYSIAAAEQELFTTYGSVTYKKNVRTTGDEWNPFSPTVAYVFETETGESILFIPDTGKSFEL